MFFVGQGSAAAEQPSTGGLDVSGRGPGVRTECVPEGEVSSSCRSPRDEWSRLRKISIHSIAHAWLCAPTVTLVDSVEPSYGTVSCCDELAIMRRSIPQLVHDSAAATAAPASTMPKPYLMLWMKPAAFVVQRELVGSFRLVVAARIPCTSRQPSSGLASSMSATTPETTGHEYEVPCSCSAQPPPAAATYQLLLC